MRGILCNINLSLCPKILSLTRQQDDDSGDDDDDVRKGMKKKVLIYWEQEGSVAGYDLTLPLSRVTRKD